MEEENTLKQLVATVNTLTQTVDNLAQNVKDGFAQVDKKIDHLASATAKGFDEVNNRFKQMDNRFDQLATATAKGFAENDEYHNEIMAEIHDLQTSRNNYASKFELGHLTKRVETLEAKIKP